MYKRNLRVSHDVGQVCPTYLCSQDNLKTGYKNKREKGLFQRRFFEHTIVNQDELNNHINYIHYNPVKHGYVKCVKDWKYSSFYKLVENKLYDEIWGSFDDIEKINTQTDCSLTVREGILSFQGRKPETIYGNL